MRGGQNRSHATAERTDRIDSFMVGGLSGVHTIVWPSGNQIRLTRKGDYLELAYCISSEDVRELAAISRVPNNYGGSRSFLICPGCGRRVRFLYLRWGRFRCRCCAKLNYQSQQATKDEFLHYHAAVKLLQEKFKVGRNQIPVPMDMPRYTPPRPKGMRWATYWNLVDRYVALVEQYGRTMIYRARAILRS